MDSRERGVFVRRIWFIWFWQSFEETAYDLPWFRYGSSTAPHVLLVRLHYRTFQTIQYSFKNYINLVSQWYDVITVIINANLSADRSVWKTLCLPNPEEGSERMSHVFRVFTEFLFQNRWNKILTGMYRLDGIRKAVTTTGQSCCTKEVSHSSSVTEAVKERSRNGKKNSFTIRSWERIRIWFPQWWHCCLFIVYVANPLRVLL